LSAATSAQLTHSNTPLHRRVTGILRSQTANDRFAPQAAAGELNRWSAALRRTERRLVEMMALKTRAPRRLTTRRFREMSLAGRRTRNACINGRCSETSSGGLPLCELLALPQMLASYRSSTWDVHSPPAMSIAQYVRPVVALFTLATHSVSSTCATLWPFGTGLDSLRLVILLVLPDCDQ
jgi:hypothetical protein